LIRQEAKAKKATAEATIAGINANFQRRLSQSLLDQRAAAIEASGATAEEARANAEAQRTATEQAARGILPVGERPAAENTLRNEYLTQTKPYRDIKAAYDRVSAAQPTPVGDIALVFSYMKMLDPGSVVREGEFATASNAGGIPTRIINLYNKAVSGDILTDGQRAKMRSQARELLKKTEQDEKQIRGGVERIAKSRGLNVDNIFYDFTAPTGGGEQPAASGDVVDTSNPLLQ
jgi:multidrug efflux pump subunit AcrA (membrane-fusion protein)